VAGWLHTKISVRHRELNSLSLFHRAVRKW